MFISPAHLVFEVLVFIDYNRTRLNVRRASLQVKLIIYDSRISKFVSETLFIKALVL